jgi:hypothetical protein
MDKFLLECRVYLYESYGKCNSAVKLSDLQPYRTIIVHSLQLLDPIEFCLLEYDAT